MSQEGLDLFYLIFEFLLESWNFPITTLNIFFLMLVVQKVKFSVSYVEHVKVFCFILFFKEYWLLVPQSLSFRAQVIPSICFGLIPIRDLYKRAILNILPTFFKHFNAFFKLAAGEILLPLFNCNNRNTFSPVGPRCYVNRMCVEMRGQGIPVYCRLKSLEI